MKEVPIHILERTLLILARVVDRNISALPIFERVDAEYQAALARKAARKAEDPIARARALAMASRARTAQVSGLASERR